MPKGNGNAFGIIAILLGASGLGLGLYMLLGDQDPIQIGTMQNVVGLWETIESPSAASYYLEFDDIQINESEYFNLTAGGTNLTLTQQGWYRLSIRFLWQSLSGAQTYFFRLYKNSSIIHILDYVQFPPNQYRAVDKTVYVYSDGDDVFSFQCVTSSVAHTISSNQENNQFIVEYVKDL